MSEKTETEEETVTTEEVETEIDTEQESDETEGEKDLGDAGKKALDAMKAKWKTAEKAGREALAELAKRDAADAVKDKPAEEQALEAARAEARAEATTAANERILKSELKAAAKGKLADPTDAHLYIDLADLTVDANGDVDSDALDDAIDELLTRKPHLAAEKARRFDGGADQGGKGKQARPSQLTESQYSALNREERRKAREDGRLTTLLGTNS